MRTLITTALASAVLAVSAGAALAQYGDAVPIGRNWRGELACPSNYVIRGNACVSIHALRRGGHETGEYPGERRWRRERYHDGYGGPPSAYGRGAVQPRVNYRGEMQCPSNYVIRGGLCVSLY